MQFGCHSLGVYEFGKVEGDDGVGTGWLEDAIVLERVASTTRYHSVEATVKCRVSVSRFEDDD